MESLFADFYNYLLKNKKIPKWVSRLFITIFFVVLITVFYLGGFSALYATGMLAAIFIWLLCVVTIYLWLVMTIKIMRYKREESTIQKT
jgi:amino acid permease